MKYILMAYVDEAAWPKMTKSEQEQGVAAYMAYTEALTKAGVLAGSARLQPTSASTTVRQWMASRRCWMAPMSIRKSSWAATT